MKGKKEKVNAELELAKAFNKLADRIEKFQNPALWQKLFSDAMNMQLPGIAEAMQRRLAPPSLGADSLSIAPPPIITSAQFTVTLSSEERDKMVEKVFEALKPELDDFGKFTKEALQKMPAHRIKHISEKIDAGEKPRLKQRPGCVFISVGFGPDDDTYLGL